MPKRLKTCSENRPFDRPSLVNLNHGSKMYEESGSENENIEENEKGENEKNMKELTYTNIGSYERGQQAEQQKIEKPKNNHEIPINEEKNEKALVTKEMTLSDLCKNICLGDSAATSHMTSNKMGVYNDWKWTKHQLHPQKNTGCDVQTQLLIHGKRN